MTLVKISIEDGIEMCIWKISEARENVRVECKDATQLHQFIEKS